MSTKPVIGISIGDVNGIGPEVILKALKELDLSQSTPVIFSPGFILEFYKENLSLNIPLRYCDDILATAESFINVIQIPVKDIDISPGKIDSNSGSISMHSISAGIEHCLAGNIHALVTAPISKESVNNAGYEIPGHTEFLALSTNTPQVLMMLVSGNLRVALVTAHISLRHVPEAITEDLIEQKVKILNESLIQDFGISSPRIAVLGVNPHAGDGGVIGNEETEIIRPVVQKLIKDGIAVEGPFPADGFFGRKQYEHFDAILAMYHDQGLAPFKLLSFGKGVNFTAGLPIIRTSPDHGTAFDIAGKGMADPSSFKQAYQLALVLAEKKIHEDRKF